MRHPISALLLLFVVVACTGIKAREKVLMPAMSLAWSTVIARHVEAGVVAGAVPVGQTTETVRVSSRTMQEVLDAGDRTAAHGIEWNVLRQVAIAGIQARVTAHEIDPGVGLSLVTTVNEFDSNWTRLLSR